MADYRDGGRDCHTEVGAERGWHMQAGRLPVHENVIDRSVGGGKLRRKSSQDEVRSMRVVKFGRNDDLWTAFYAGRPDEVDGYNITGPGHVLRRLNAARLLPNPIG